MKAEIIAIGDELTSGQRLDTNSQWLSRQLGDLGIETIRHTTVGDDLAQIMDVFESAASRAHLVVCTGGLGPTLDDLTRQAMAEAFGRPLELHAASLERIQQMFASRNREMPERNRLQAMFPAGSQVIPNPHGSAPGIDFQVPSAAAADSGTARFFALPGVPAEMKQMWRETVLQRIEGMNSDQRGALHYRLIRVFGIGESDVEVRLPHLIARDRDPMVGITVSRATITLRIVSRAHSAEEFEEKIRPTVDEIQSALGDLVFGTGDVELQDVVSQELARRGQQMGCLEVGAASWIGDWMLAVDQPQPTFAGSYAFPTLDAAARWLAVSAQSTAPAADLLWLDLARATQQRLNVDLALVTGIYPTQQQMVLAGQPFDIACAIAYGSQTMIHRQRMGGHPDVLGPRMAKTGLDQVRRVLLGLLDAEPPAISLRSSLS